MEEKTKFYSYRALKVLAIRKGGENVVNSVEEEEFIFNLKEEIENRR